MTHDTRIGECDTCRARFKVPASFRADRARCRECGGVVVLEVPRPVPRPPLERSRKVKSTGQSGPRRDEPKDERSSATTSARPDKLAGERTEDRAPERATSGAHHVVKAPTQSGAKSPTARAEPAKSAQPDEKRDSTSGKDSKKSGGVLGSIVAAAKAAVWRKKRGK